MQKAHLYEAILLLHRGMAPGVGEGMYRATVATPEHVRAQVNLQFLADMEQAGGRDAERYERRRESDERDSRARTAS